MVVSGDGRAGGNDSYWGCGSITVDRDGVVKRKERWSGIKTRSFRLPAYRLIARPNRLSNWVSRVECACLQKSQGPVLLELTYTYVTLIFDQRNAKEMDR